MTHRINSEIRGAGLLGPVATLEYRALSPNQPLILTREPTNQKDPNAIIIKTVIGQPCGYLAKEDAAVVSPQMDAGILWLAKVTAGPFARRWAQCLLWRERGREDKYRQYAIAYGASELMVAAILQKKFLKEDAQ